ncbi:MAG: hypothetical protein AB7O98_01585 [Hyphomonadaceae bacterium]
MNGRIPDTLAAPALGGRVLVGRSGVALMLALGAGGVALASPQAALFALAALGAWALIGNEALRIDLPSFVGPACAALIVGAFAGLAGAIGVVFVWRLFSDTRWSVAEAARLAHAAGRPAEASWKSLAHAWLTPLYGLTLVAFTAPHMVAGLPLDLPHVPMWVPLAAGGLACAGAFDWALRRAADWRLGELASAPALHLLAHHVVFVMAFGLMIDVSAGLVALVAWRLAHAAPLPRLS